MSFYLNIPIQEIREPIISKIDRASGKVQDVDVTKTFYFFYLFIFIVNFFHRNLPLLAYYIHLNTKLLTIFLLCNLSAFLYQIKYVTK